MPYIPAERRPELLAGDPPKTPGELNFLLSSLYIEYLETHGENYQTYNDILGAIEGSKIELYLRKTSPYEKGAVERNGDIY